MPFISGIGLISPQKTIDDQYFLTEVMEYETEYLRCIEPVYRNFIDPIQSRRMSRLIKMGIVAAKISIADAGIPVPDAIITGTGLGSVEDTEKILADISREGGYLNPTPFIQSTYNTISSQVAIMLRCHNYNSTYVHRSFSFESGLIDGLLQISEGTAENFLAGAVDEMTLNHLQITRRIGLWKMHPVNNLRLMEDHTPGALAGEGAAFFVITGSKQDSSYALLKDVKTMIDLNGRLAIDHELDHFLSFNGLNRTDIDLLLLGYNSDINYDHVYGSFQNNLFPQTAAAWFKHLCGEYHTASGFGLYIAANVLKHQYLPEILRYNQIRPEKLNRILIYNQFRNTNHSFILVERCR